MRIQQLSCSILVMSLFTASPVFAKKATEDPSAKKRAVIEKIIAVVDADKLTSAEADAVKQKQKARLEELGNFVADKMDIPESKREAFKERMKEHKKTQEAIPPEVKAEFNRKMDVPGFTKDATYKVLGDHLDEKDLKAILKFMKTSTGTKLIKEAPDMLCQLGVLAGEHFIPIFMDIFKQLKMIPGMMPPGMMPPSFHPRDQKQQEMMDQMKKLIEQHRPKVPPSGPGKDET